MNINIRPYSSLRVSVGGGGGNGHEQLWVVCAGGGGGSGFIGSGGRVGLRVLVDVPAEEAEAEEVPS